MKISVALDLGTTLVKGGELDENGTLNCLHSGNVPHVMGHGLIRESDANAYYDSATFILDSLRASQPDDIPVGLASQRSSFLLWDRETSIPVTPLISWEDRRAETWCAEHRDVDMDHIRRTGLLMSPHYPGTKLAYLFANDTSLMERADSLMFGQIDTYCMWRWCREHIVDRSMASRTLLLELGATSWSDYLVDYFAVPEKILPFIVPTYGRASKMEGGGILTASISDQAAGLIALGGDSEASILVNIGTGGFVTVSTGDEQRHVDGFLTGPALSRPDESVIYATEGTINGVVAAFGEYDIDALSFPESESLPDVFCIPDTSGLGAPFWRAESNQEWSSPPSDLVEADRYRIVMEGVLFRICHIIQSIGCKQTKPRIYLSGGLSRSRFLQVGLATCLDVSIHVLKQRDATLLGAARLAAGNLDWPEAESIEVAFSDEAKYLTSKYKRWLEWVE